MTTCSHISVVVSTCNRPDDLYRCLESLRAVRYPSWDVILIDQSDDERSETIVNSFASMLPNLKYQRMHRKGLSAARNQGVEATTGGIVAFLDDDCIVHADWLERIAAAFARHPSAALVFGAVTSLPHDPKDFFVPVYPVRKEQVVRGRPGFARPDGMGASMCLRRAIYRTVGPFDEYLGAGSVWFKGGEDNDYIYRCLISGHSVIRVPSIKLVHHGARSSSNGAASRHLLNNAYCAAAIDMKLLRCGHPEALIVMASHTLFFLLRTNLRGVISRRVPSHIALLLMYIRGLLACFQLGVDRRRNLFVETPKRISDKVGVA